MMGGLHSAHTGELISCEKKEDASTGTGSRSLGRKKVDGLERTRPRDKEGNCKVSGLGEG